MPEQVLHNIFCTSNPRAYWHPNLLCHYSSELALHYTELQLQTRTKSYPIAIKYTGITKKTIKYTVFLTADQKVSETQCHGIVADSKPEQCEQSVFGFSSNQKN
jgi:hypothetical protein